LACAGITWISRNACLDAMIVNSTGSTIRDVRITYLGSTRSVGDLSPWFIHRLGRFGYGWTPVTVSYIDGRGKRVNATRRIGVDLRRPISSDGDDGQAVIDIEPAGVIAARWYWVSWW
jgi:hypothetical protein